MAKRTGNNNKRSSAPKSEWIDISIPFYDNMMQGDQEPLLPHIEHVRSPKKGDKTTVTQINICSHVGTHVDAPLHMIDGGTSIDKMPLDATIGPARVIEIKDPVSIKMSELAQYDIQPGERILFKTRTSYRPGRWDTLLKDAVYLSSEVIDFLAKTKIRCVGIDYITIGNFRELETIRKFHLKLFKAGVFIIEDLDLEGVEPGAYEFSCLPLRIKEGDAAPARAAIRHL
jgi:arylformamidase